jgi:hypothetical protein
MRGSGWENQVAKLRVPHEKLGKAEGRTADPSTALRSSAFPSFRGVPAISSRCEMLLSNWAQRSISNTRRAL